MTRSCQKLFCHPNTGDVTVNVLKQNYEQTKEFFIDIAANIFHRLVSGTRLSTICPTNNFRLSVFRKTDEKISIGQIVDNRIPLTNR